MESLVQLSSRLTLNHDEVHVCGSLTELASFLYPISRRTITDENYSGTQISFDDGVTMRAFDGTVPRAPKLIAFQDLVGQPTWIAPAVIQAKFVLRGDLDINDTITLPPSLVGTSAAAMTSLSGNPANMTTFSGNYVIQSIHHWGNFRQPDSSAWATVVDMIKLPPAIASDGAGS